QGADTQLRANKSVHRRQAGNKETRSPGYPKHQHRVMLTGSIFSILLITMILMAVCVYKPIRRR
uniref:Uncharacterized protein n=1 Tax=Chelonoidis abingdonii TaxID=106734 RepID=A0A8C0JBF6_CHEAB